MKATNTKMCEEDVQIAAACACSGERWDVMQSILTLADHVSPTPWPRLIELAVQCASRVGHPEEAVPLFEKGFGKLKGMWLSVDNASTTVPIPDRTTLNTLIASLCAVGNLSLALDVHGFMVSRNISPSVPSFSPLFDAIAGKMSQIVSNSSELLDTEGADSPQSEVEGLLTVALELYHRMMSSLSPESRGSVGFRDAVTSAIQCCTSAGDSEGAMRLLHDLQVSEAVWFGLFAFCHDHACPDCHRSTVFRCCGGSGGFNGQCGPCSRNVCRIVVCRQDFG